MFCPGKTILLSLALCFFSGAVAQTTVKRPLRNLSVGGHYAYGSFLTSEPKAAYLRDSYSSFGELYFQVQTDGSKAWQVANGLPQWGVGIQYGNLGSKEHIGKLVAAYPFLNIPLFAYKALESKLRIGAGAGWVEKPYHPETNHKNVLVGSHLNAYLHLLWQNEVKLAPRLFAAAGVGFSHLSNGGSSLPNLGINTPTLQAGLRYAFDESFEESSAPRDSFSRRPFYRLGLSVAGKQYPWIGGERYLVTILNAEIMKRTSYRHQFGAGVVLFHNPSLEHDPSGLLSVKREGNQLQAGAYAAYERLFGKLSLPVQLGAYLHNRDRFPVLYQQIGLRYQLTPRWSASALLKTHLGKADYINAGIGYTFNSAP